MDDWSRSILKIALEFSFMGASHPRSVSHQISRELSGGRSLSVGSGNRSHVSVINSITRTRADFISTPGVVLPPHLATACAV
jgi:hypothetical protein